MPSYCSSGTMQLSAIPDFFIYTRFLVIIYTIMLPSCITLILRCAQDFFLTHPLSINKKWIMNKFEFLDELSL